MNFLYLIFRSTPSLFNVQIQMKHFFKIQKDLTKTVLLYSFRHCLLSDVRLKHFFTSAWYLLLLFFFVGYISSIIKHFSRNINEIPHIWIGRCRYDEWWLYIFVYNSIIIIIILCMRIVWNTTDYNIYRQARCDATMIVTHIYTHQLWMRNIQVLWVHAYISRSQCLILN